MTEDAFKIFFKKIAFLTIFGLLTIMSLEVFTANVEDSASIYNGCMFFINGEGHVNGFSEVKVTPEDSVSLLIMTLIVICHITV